VQLVSAGFSNWSGGVRVPETVVERPADEAALAQRIAGLAPGERLRAVGSGHSFAPFWAPGDAIVALDAFAGLRAVDGARARLGAGTPIHAVGPLLAAEGRALANQGDIDRQTLAGALATGTHGTGTELGSLSSMLRGLRLVDGTGAIRTIDGGDALEAARVSLGLLGVFTEVTLETVPVYGLHERNVREPVGTTLEALAARLAAHRHHEFWWVPREDTCIAKTLDAIEPPRRERLDEIPFGAAGERWGVAWRVFPSAREARFEEMEYAVPVEAGPACFRAVREILLERFPKLPWPVEYRVVAGDPGWLSPTGGRTVAAISIHQGTDRDCAPLFEAVEPVLRDHGGRPHWGKRHGLDAATLAGRYPRLPDFVAERTRADPSDRLLTPALAPVFGA
jgi:FAD/FMN-containing dehydrogenase